MGYSGWLAQGFGDDLGMGTAHDDFVEVIAAEGDPNTARGVVVHHGEDLGGA